MDTKDDILEKGVLIHTSNGEADVDGNTTQARTHPTLGVKGKEAQVAINQSLRSDEIYDAYTDLR